MLQLIIEEVSNEFDPIALYGFGRRVYDPEKAGDVDILAITKGKTEPNGIYDKIISEDSLQVWTKSTSNQMPSLDIAVIPKRLLMSPKKLSQKARNAKDSVDLYGNHLQGIDILPREDLVKTLKDYMVRQGITDFSILDLDPNVALKILTRFFYSLSKRWNICGDIYSELKERSHPLSSYEVEEYARKLIEITSKYIIKF